MKCDRCLNEDENYFYNLHGHYYCRKCIGYGKSKILSDEYNRQQVDYHLDYELTSLQKKVSAMLVERYQQHHNTILKAVCGAGKTEMIYEVIKYALNMGQRVCFTTPRKELVIEIAARIKQQFYHIEPTVVYGGHSDLDEGQFIICTTHQLYRYRHYFDLLILDEYDAFPYYHNEVLENILKTSIRGHYIFMSATLVKGDINILLRYHQNPIPVPQCIVASHVMIILLMLRLVKKYVYENKPVLIFVPTIVQTKLVSNYLKIISVKHGVASSQCNHIHSLIDQLKMHHISAIVTTTVLERGITIADIQVIVFHGEHQVFSKETLIQIAGRVGRIQPYVDGKITIYACRKTKAIKQCIKQLTQDNVLSAMNS